MYVELQKTSIIFTDFMKQHRYAGHVFLLRNVKSKCRDYTHIDSEAKNLSLVLKEFLYQITSQLHCVQNNEGLCVKHIQII